MVKCPLCDFISQDKYQWFNHLTFHHKADEYIDWMLDMIPRSKVEKKIKELENRYRVGLNRFDKNWSDYDMATNANRAILSHLQDLLNDTKVE